MLMKLTPGITYGRIRWNICSLKLTLISGNEKQIWYGLDKFVYTCNLSELQG